MTTIRWLSPLTMLGSALVLPAGPAGSGHGRPGDATRRGVWRSRAAGPAVPGPAAPGLARPAGPASPAGPARMPGRGP
jgi:hypothetical protein